MSPTSTIPYEVLLEFVNDTNDTATMRVLHREAGNNSGATLLIHRGESVSLVLTAGSTYKYALRQHRKDANVSVKVWQDTRCPLSSVFAAQETKGPDDDDLPTASGVKITISTRAGR
ncbi:hypothetical protein K474DRAFT_1658364 [Panus rudis PR-1116 ss-1]|nr:hypothetical protein K474DRAFT_1658364 [Panus rudis PR-1116 ss-1]